MSRRPHAAPAGDGDPGRRRLLVWDAPVRLFHWSLVVMLCLSWWTGERHEMEWHRRSGYVILGLLVFRLWWGVAGSRTARFGNFVKGPRAVVAYLRRLLAASHPPAHGHNPLGGWSVVAMLAVLIAMVATGLFAIDVDGLESGPLSDLIDFDRGRLAASAHHLLFDAILVLSGLHLAAILFYVIVKRHNLVAPMIHGRRVADDDGMAPIRVPRGSLVVGLLLAALVVTAIVTGLRF